jgi:hypothetical protein
MSAKPPKLTESRAEPAASGGAEAPAKRRPLGWVRDVLGRSVKLEQRRNQLHVTLVDPKKAAEPEKPMTLLMQQCTELGARLLVHDPATQPVRHLFVLHEALLAGGWEKVEALSPKVLDRALTEAEILDCAEPSPMLTTILEELRAQKSAADARAAREAAEAEWEVPQVPEVSDSDFAEWELMERSWAGTIPAGLELPARDTTM